ncbi:putative adaptor gamma-1 chain [Trypanosoma rangeli]|uniref:AP-1 complex subunit gamma n=1 Tax=Trypanosoma rangeli TaxID=5698 RepID=A0A422NSY3_TRYRA|nr:putative adaptor gamma-1 chain [Trypanosoma rangeli]RNF08563.1 putative adaptor gamma-1 chain [Trypanosoma rangeli]|eukprot:RNF08563.1 putative adaptor gamma-1 chain [Trypanosoma rangeli]
MDLVGAVRLRDLVSAVRQCRTSAEERALIKRECAIIRESFRENKPLVRTRNMLKLLYITMLGYPTEFGQVEVVSLLAQADYAGKRVGYLTLQMVLDENDEVLTLSENHIKQDLTQSQPLIQAMALNVVANIASEVMARDMLDEVSRLALSSNTYLSKKACLAAIRIVKKVPEYAEVFLEMFTDMFRERSPGELLAAVTLVNECLRLPQGEAFLPKYRPLVNAAVRVLKQLILSSRVTDQDVLGVTDPFLQVKLLQFMRIIGTGSAVTSEALNDVLAQVLTNTDATRNVGCSVQYECVKTIYAIESDEGLCTLGINTISRFLSSSDNNQRFVALKSLLGYASRHANAVREHQDTILDCLKDVDISIRRRALDLTVALVTEDNLRLLVPDLVSYLTVSAEEMREDVTLHLCRIIESKSPNTEWRVEYSLRVLRLAKQYAPVEFATRLIALLSKDTTETQTSAVVFMWDEASYPFDALHQSRKAFLVAAVWGIGEYVDLLIRAKSVKPEDVAKCIAEITTNSAFSIIKCYGLTSLMKIAARYPSAKAIALTVFSNYSKSLDCELQQRAFEYTTLLESFAEEAAFCFTRMPSIYHVEDEEAEVQPVPQVNLPPEVLQQKAAVALENLFDVDPKPTTATPAAEKNVKSENTAQAIDDLFGLGSNTSSAIASQSTLWGAAASTEKEPPQPAEVHVFDCDDFTASVSAVVQGVINASVIVVSRLPTAMENLSIQAAVPKTSMLNIGFLTSTAISPYGRIVQQLTVDNSKSNKNPRLLTLRVKLLYTVDGDSRSQMFQVSQEV